VGLKRGPLNLVSTTEELLGKNSSGSGLENQKYGRGDPLRWPRDTLHPQMLAQTSPAGGGRSVGIVRLRTKATEFVCLFLFNLNIIPPALVVSFLLYFPQNPVCIPLLPIYAIPHAHLILLDLTTIIILDEEHKLWSSSQWSLLWSATISLLFCPIILHMYLPPMHVVSHTSAWLISLIIFWYRASKPEWWSQKRWTLLGNGEFNHVSAATNTLG
jgi:hypothetical protein